MVEIPTIHTERLTLRPFSLDDAGAVQRLAGDRDIAATTILIPHPYPDGAAEEWIGTHAGMFEHGEGLTVAVTARAGGVLHGAVSLTIDARHHHAELGYWIGKAYWGRGYATEAARAVVDYGFHTLKLHRVFAHHMARNAASGRVLEKLGMRYEGTLAEHVRKWDDYEDIRHFGLLARDYDG